VAAQSKYGAISSELKEIPGDEPVFLLRGQDLLAPRAIRAYADQLYREAVRRADDRLAGVADQCEELAEAMLNWQTDNPDRTKYPD
jgi:hypothetical protein